MLNDDHVHKIAHNNLKSAKSISLIFLERSATTNISDNHVFNLRISTQVIDG